MAKNDYLHMRVDPGLKSALQAEAKRRYIDTSSLVSLILGAWLEANERAKDTRGAGLDLTAGSSSSNAGADPASSQNVTPSGDNDPHKKS